MAFGRRGWMSELKKNSRCSRCGEIKARAALVLLLLLLLLLLLCPLCFNVHDHGASQLLCNEFVVSARLFWREANDTLLHGGWQRMAQQFACRLAEGCANQKINSVWAERKRKQFGPIQMSDLVWYVR